MFLEISVGQIFNIYENFKSEITETYVGTGVIDSLQLNTCAGDVDPYIEESKEIMKENEQKKKEIEETKENIWQIEIPRIDLVAPIAEGTSQDIMLESVGHFENTSTWKGNIGLAAHNRGYPINFFSRLKELKLGDEIIYKTEFGIRKCFVKIIEIIEDTNWSYLQETKDNRITLITCVENQPSERLCIQGIEI